jgi:hypothetical protein
MSFWRECNDRRILGMGKDELQTPPRMLRSFFTNSSMTCKQAVRGACPEVPEGSLSNHNGDNIIKGFKNPLLDPFPIHRDSGRADFLILLG